MSGTGIAGAQDHQSTQDRIRHMAALCRAMSAYLTASDPTGCLPDDTTVIEAMNVTGGAGVVITAGMIRAAGGMTNPCPHARSAAEFITSRAIMGREKYGHTLADAALSPAKLVRHAREESGDLLVYLTALEETMAKLAPTDDLTDAVAAEMWRVYEASPIAREGSKGISWVRLKDLAASHPDKAPAVIRQVGLDEARAAIGVVRRYDAIAKPASTRPAVTREAVTEIVMGGAEACQRVGGTCQDDPACYCRRTIDALMALIIGGES